MPKLADVTRGLLAANEESCSRENAGDAHWFNSWIPASFTMMRADGTIVDRARFINDLRASGQRRIRDITVTLEGQSRAIARCVIDMAVGGTMQSFRSVRLFVKLPDQNWQWISCADEPLG